MLNHLTIRRMEERKNIFIGGIMKMFVSDGMRLIVRWFNIYLKRSKTLTYKLGGMLLRAAGFQDNGSSAFSNEEASGKNECRKSRMSSRQVLGKTVP